MGIHFRVPFPSAVSTLAGFVPGGGPFAHALEDYFPMTIGLIDPVPKSRPIPSTVPTALGERIEGYDVARSLALLGMFVGHFSSAFSYDTAHPAWLATFYDYYLTGRQTATFFVLVGVGLTLMSRRAAVSGNSQAIARARKTLVYRGLFLFTLGFATFVWVQWDILRIYGVALVMASCLITASSRRVLLGALGLVLGFVVLFLVLDFKENWDWPSWPHLTYLNLWSPSGLFRNVFFDGFRSVFPWAGFVLFGMWLGRLPLRQAAVNNRVLMCALGALVIAEVTSALGVWYIYDHFDGLDVEAMEALITTRSMPALPLFVIASGSVGVTVIALSVRLVDAWPGRLWQPLVATGQMALTWWIGHIVFMEIALRMHMVPIVSLRSATAYGILFFALVALVSWLWKMRFRNGPLEWVMRKVTG
jgi:uncharacterized protein